MNLGLKIFVKLSVTLCYWIIHKPKLQTYDFRGSKAHDTSYHKKEKTWYKKKSNHHKPAWDVRAKEMCIKWLNNVILY